MNKNTITVVAVVIIGLGLWAFLGGSSGPLPKCESQQVKAAVKQAVQDKFALIGLPVGSLNNNVYDRLIESHSYTADALKRSQEQDTGLSDSDIEICSVDSDAGELLLTVLMRKDGISGVVQNFGAPGEIAEFKVN